MRTVVILLILANLTLFGYTFLDGASGGESFRLAQQIQPEKIKLLTPQQVAALGPAKVASLADVCLEWGPLSDAERTRALADLDPLGLGKLVSQKKVEATTTYWTFIPPFATKAAATKRLDELKAEGLADAFIVDGGAQRFAISLGAWRSEDAANVAQSALSKRGITGVRVAPRQQTVVETALVVRDPQTSAVTRIKELSAAYPGSELKISSCDKPAG
jgi:hypothetical protein